MSSGDLRTLTWRFWIDLPAGEEADGGAAATVTAGYQGRLQTKDLEDPRISPSSLGTSTTVYVPSPTTAS